MTATARPAPATLAELVSGPIATVSPTATLRAATELLAADVLGLLVVVRDTTVLGVLSERDVVTALADGADADLVRVGEVASDRPVSLPHDADAAAAATTMLEAEIRHLLVTDGRDAPLGVVSIRDVLRALLADSQAAQPA